MLEVHAVLSMLPALWDCLPKLRHLPRLRLLLCASLPIACEEAGAWHRFLLTRTVCCPCRVVPSWPSPSGARAGCLVRCDSSRVMSRCFGLPHELAGSSRFCAICTCSPNFCSSSMSSRRCRCRCWRLDRRRSGPVARCAWALCRAEFYRRLDGEVGSHVDHVRRCRWVGSYYLLACCWCRLCRVVPEFSRR